MPDLKQVFAQEIIRLARKELKKQSLPLAQAYSKLRKELAEVKKSLKDLEKKLAVCAPVAPQAAAPAPAAQAKGEAKPGKKRRSTKKSARKIAGNDAKAGKKRRFTGARLHAYREKLHLSQVQLAKLIGVSTRTVCLWEAGKSAPQSKQLDKVYELRALGMRAIKQRCKDLGIVLPQPKKAPKAKAAAAPAAAETPKA